MIVPILSSLAAAQLALGSAVPMFNDNFDLLSRASETCSNTQLSCHNTTVQTNLCCFNAPGGSLLQTQFWDTDPTDGPANSWTIHGLWPDECDGSFQENCDSSRDYTGISSILDSFGKQDLVTYMNTYWKNQDGTDEELWEHEWATHGTCISTLDTSCYTNYQSKQEVPDFFQTVVDLFQTLPTYEWLSAAGITPSSSKTYTSAEIQAALSAQHGQNVYLGCSSGSLNQVYYYFNVQGSVQDGTFEAAAPDGGDTSNCPSTGIKYAIKSGASTTVGTSTPTSTATNTRTSTKTTSTKVTTTSSGSQPTGSSVSGKGTLNVESGGSQDGCIISGGTWYTTGTCATFTATPSGSGFTLTSSKGTCGISSNALKCGSGVSATVFTVADGNLAVGGSTSFYADSAPTGSTQATVYTTSDSTEITITWQGS